MKGKREVEIKAKVMKLAPSRRLVYSIVYAPHSVDAHGDYMEMEDVEKMAHDFLASGATRNVDVQHDNKCDRGCYVVESFIVREGDPDFSEVGAWAVGIYVGDEGIWKKVLSGEITGLSMEAWVEREELG